MENDKLEVLEELYFDLKAEHFRLYKEMEWELLGMMLLKKGRCIPAVCKHLNTGDFASDEYGAIFNACANLYEEGTVPTMPLIADWLEKHDYSLYDENTREVLTNSTWNNAGHVALQTIMRLGNAAFTDAYAEDYAIRLASAALERKLLKAKIQGIKDIFSGKMSVAEILDKDQRTIDEITGVSASKNASSIDEFVAGKKDVEDISDSDLFQYFEQFQKYAARKTGFDNLDRVQIFPPSVQVIGGTPGTGKTTFCWQLLNQFAARGETCLYFSFEMSKAEMFTKTLAAEHFKICSNRDIKPLSAVGIRRGDFWSILHEKTATHPLYDSALAFLDGVIPYVREQYKNHRIIPCSNETIEGVLRMIHPYCQAGKKPIVCIDYLQLISPTDTKLNETENLKIVMKKLKNFAANTDTTFIVISALNRESYSGGDTLKGFRGTSAIEFSCDAAYLMNLEFDSKMETVEQAMRNQPRKIRLKCLKNRFGNGFEIHFDYYSANDYFQPIYDSTTDDEPDEEENTY